MGCQLQPNHGLLVGAIVHLLALINKDTKEAKRLGLKTDANELWKLGAYVCVLAAASLRGHKGFYLDLAGMRKHLHSKGRFGDVPVGINKSTILTEEVCRKLPHITICLLGKFKGETGASFDYCGEQNFIRPAATVVDRKAGGSLQVRRAF